MQPNPNVWFGSGLIPNILVLGGLRAKDLQSGSDIGMLMETKQWKINSGPISNQINEANPQVHNYTTNCTVYASPTKESVSVSVCVIVQHNTHIL
ncbi:hypothetical protein XELAEV_18041555mg [Xenopus laevis]|uniref:Uncharacterized protein n=1 Tax=Xenopus laevis TaxID=8355 RepID=A0A974H5H6_XENLA|nr:hypothetical protein XELAEV_18041555mg [Xenopus laevis]